MRLQKNNSWICLPFILLQRMKPDPELELLDVFNETYFSAKVEKRTKIANGTCGSTNSFLAWLCSSPAEPLQGNWSFFFFNGSFQRSLDADPHFHRAQQQLAVVVLIPIICSCAIFLLFLWKMYKSLRTLPYIEILLFTTSMFKAKVNRINSISLCLKPTRWFRSRTNAQIILHSSAEKSS